MLLLKRSTSVRSLIASSASYKIIVSHKHSMKQLQYILLSRMNRLCKNYNCFECPTSSRLLFLY
jgi:hypothetical protein